MPSHRCVYRRTETCGTNSESDHAVVVDGVGTGLGCACGPRDACTQADWFCRVLVGTREVERSPDFTGRLGREVTPFLRYSLDGLEGIVPWHRGGRTD